MLIRAKLKARPTLLTISMSNRDLEINSIRQCCGNESQKKFRVTLPKSHVEKEFATIDVLGYAINSMSLTEILLNVPERHKKN